MLQGAVQWLASMLLTITRKYLKGKGAIQTESTRLVVTEQRRQKDTTGIGDQNISIPALSIVPVEEISENGVFAVLVELVHLLLMETELWVKHNQSY
jgi:hypothetical protein